MGYRRYYRDDPRWLEARRTGTCDGCGRRINGGDRAYWFPIGRRIYCQACGEPHARRFEAEAEDEDIFAR